ncbi:hypothetical protein [Haloarchaeobius iranensis]|uniref:Uncharacterized protein n=1 Tax=Haloarchaeobius iranensis TaxID=996166 RepID=A0A1G9W7N8_9EURY|nr:hypothetical protein [Haloarchaeobius iranensis]SDM80277.1 hypothetical protein SAMN05192554_107192 [Haloarchaeobius iranensis]
MATEESNSSGTGAERESDVPGEGTRASRWIGKRWYKTSVGIVTAALLAVLTGVGLAVSTGVVAPAFTEHDPSAAAAVPPYVYLYGGLGGLAYVFTSMVVEFEKTTEELGRAGLRLLAAPLLAAGIYLLMRFFLNSPSTRQVAGLSFLVGLYVKVTIEALGSLARRLYGQPTGRARDGRDDSG